MWRFWQFIHLNEESIGFRVFQKCHFPSGSLESWPKKLEKKGDGGKLERALNELLLCESFEREPG